MKKVLIIIGVIVILVAGFFILKNPKQIDESGLQKASLQFSWLPNAVFAGDLVGIDQFGKKNGIDISYEFGGPGVNPIQLVVGGQKTFGWASADEVLAANEKGADLAIIGVIHDVNPTAFASLAEKNITTLKDLEGKKVGVLPFGGSTMLYEIMLKKNGIDRNKISEITISGDIKQLISGAYDVQPVILPDEVVTMDLEKVNYNLILAEDYGTKPIKGYVYFAKRSVVEENPELVQLFINTMADGWNYAIKNPKKTIEIFKKLIPEADVVRETKVLEVSNTYVNLYNNQPLNSNVNHGWQEMVGELKSVGFLKNDVNFSRVLQFQFVNEYYK